MEPPKNSYSSSPLISLCHKLSHTTPKFTSGLYYTMKALTPRDFECWLVDFKLSLITTTSQAFSITGHDWFWLWTYVQSVKAYYVRGLKPECTPWDHVSHLLASVLWCLLENLFWCKLDDKHEYLHMQEVRKSFSLVLCLSWGNVSCDRKKIHLLGNVMIIFFICLVPERHWFLYVYRINALLALNSFCFPLFFIFFYLMIEMNVLWHTGNVTDS